MSEYQELPEDPVGRYLTKLREAAGMTHTQLAKKVRVSSSTLSRIESGEKAATPDEISFLTSPDISSGARQPSYK